MQPLFLQINQHKINTKPRKQSLNIPIRAHSQLANENIQGRRHSVNSIMNTCKNDPLNVPYIQILQDYGRSMDIPLVKTVFLK